MRRCPICETQGKEIFKGKILQKYEVQYYQCPTCAFIYTDSPYWLPEAYSGNNAIVDIDTGIMQRNVTDVLLVNMLVKLCFSAGKYFLDWGGGYGIFTRMMRDLGYNWLWYDKYSENLVARGFEYCDFAESGKREKIDLITAFELFEHFDNPLKEIEELLSVSKNIVFSTEIYDDDFVYKNLKDWWYYAPQTGQHIGFYSKKTLEYLAKMNHVHYYKINNCMHLFTERKISITKIKLLTNSYSWLMQYYLYHVNRKKGLAIQDMQVMIERE